MAEQNEKLNSDKLIKALKEGAMIFLNPSDFAQTRRALLDRGCDYEAVQALVHPCEYLEPGVVVACKPPPPADPHAVPSAHFDGWRR